MNFSSIVINVVHCHLIIKVISISYRFEMMKRASVVAKLAVPVQKGEREINVRYRATL